MSEGNRLIEEVKLLEVAGAASSIKALWAGVNAGSGVYPGIDYTFPLIDGHATFWCAASSLSPSDGALIAGWNPFLTPINLADSDVLHVHVKWCLWSLDGAQQIVLNTTGQTMIPNSGEYDALDTDFTITHQVGDDLSLVDGGGYAQVNTVAGGIFMQALFVQATLNPAEP